MSIRGLTELVTTPARSPVEEVELSSPDGTILLRRLVRDGATAAEPEQPSAGAPVPMTKLLSESLSPALITAYAAFIAVVSQVVSAPTADDPNPEQYLAWRWAGLVALVALSVALTAVTIFPAAAKSGKPRIVPILGVASVTVTSLAWGIALPASPLLAAVSKPDGAILVAFCGFVGLGVSALVSAWLRSAKTAADAAENAVA